MRNFVLLALVLGLAACRGGDDGGGDDNPMPDGQTTEDVKIQDIQNDSMPACDPADPATCVQLNLKGVVVTAIDSFGMRTGDFWVQEPEGGEYSGIQVYGAPLDQVALLQIGDVVDISGAQKSEFALDSDTSGNKLTELEPYNGSMTVTKISSGTPLEPKVVNALEIGQMTDYTARAAEWEKWEGVLVTVTNVQAFSDTECITSMGNCNDPTYERFDITGDIQVQSSLAAMPSTEVAQGDCLSGVTGVIGYFFDYQILPRTTDEIGTGGTACPVENTAETCEDNIDNDGNGFKDCSDNACIAASATCRTEMTIEEIQTATTPPTGGVDIKGVCVAAQSRPVGNPKAPRNLWVQTSNTVATLNNGIYIYGPGSDLSAFTPGKKVDIVGTVKEFNDSQNMGTGTLTEVSAISITAASGTCSPTPILDQSVATLSMDANGEPAESVLIELKNVAITVAATSNNYFAGTMQQGGASGPTFKFDDDSFQITSPAGTCYSSIKGIWSYQVYDNAWYFLPTAAGTTTTCP